MMKVFKRITATVLSLLLVFTFQMFSIVAHAVGVGTEENPYWIETADQLQNINEDVTAHYVLKTDIDLGNVDFTPIGNATSGAFSGSFDGNGYTISNLSVFSGKYAGLFGCNEGTIKNVKLSGIFVYGTRYVGGVVGHNTTLGTVENCTVLSGDVESDGGLNDVNVGGICGYNEGVIQGTFSNCANVTAENTDAYAYAGGIVANSTNEISFTASNYGDVFSSTYSGGLIGLGDSNVFTNCYNTGSISGSYQYFGGLIGCGNNNSMTNCYNTGKIFCTTGSTSYGGGLIGIGNNNSLISSYNLADLSSLWCSGGLICEGHNNTIINSYNVGDISCRYWFSGGLVGRGDRNTIINCYNTGNISYGRYAGGLIGDGDSITITNCYNTGNVVGEDYSGGLIGRSYYGTVINCYNTGNISSGTSSVSGIVCSGNSYNITNCYNSGNISNDYGGGIADFYDNSSILTNCYSNRESCHGYGKNGILLFSNQMKNISNYASWDFTDVWVMGGNINSGFPILKEVSSPLQLDVVNKTMMVGETLQLTAYKNGVVTNDVSWSVSYGSAVVNNTGKITASAQGIATITATDSDGNKANCNIYVMTPNSSATLNNFSINKDNTGKQYITLGVSNSGDFITEATSSDSSILEITSFGGTGITVTAIEPGVVTLNFKTAQGYTGSCTATVTNLANSITINNFNNYINRGETKQIPFSTSPTGNTSLITWTSSNPAIATVDQNGNVTGLAIGQSKITATTDSGCSNYCYIYVIAPVKSLTFTEESITLEQGQTYQTSIIKDPVDTTDSISYRSESSSIASVNSSTGLITASSSYTGKTTITATASSGVKAYLEVTVVEKKVDPTDITLNYDEKTMILGDDFDLIPTLSPSNASADITYSTDDESVATVDENGNVKAAGEGTTIIRVNTSNGLSTYCVVTVYGFTNVNGVEYFDIYALEDFIIFRDFVNKSAENSTVNARLMVDIDLSSVCSETLGSFTPIGSVDSPYNGIFNGNGHKIKNLYIDSTTYSGLFGYLGADGNVSNLVLENANVTGTNYVGGVAGKSEGTIEKVTVSGEISGTSYVGGIVGSNSGSIKYCGNTANLTATSIVGGVAGDSSSASTISNSYSACEISASDYRQGGLCGMNYGAISNSYYDNTLFTGSVVGRGNSDNCENSAKPSTAFESGEITYLLNADLEDTVFYQTLGTDLYPILNNKHSQVYFGFENCNSGKEIYSNSVVYPDKPNHNFVDDVCTICGVKNTTIVIREQTFIEGLIYGSHSVEWLENELKNMDEITAEDIYIEVYNFEGLQLLDNSYHVGTASTVHVYDSSTDELINMYTVVLYGDVNGDGIIDELDTDIIKGLALSTSEQEPVGNWKWFLMAADTNHDGAVDGFDVIETQLQTLDMHIIEQKNSVAYISKDEIDEETEINQE